MNDLSSPISCDLMKAGDESQICELVIRVFNEFNASLYSDEGVRGFYSYANPYELAKRSKENCIVFSAKADGRFIGMIEIRDYEHISLLFVDRDFHNKGIGRRLLKSALSQCRVQKPDMVMLTVNASPYAVNIYKKLGFSVAGTDRTENGIFFTPMLLALNASTLAY